MASVVMVNGKANNMGTSFTWQQHLTHKVVIICGSTGVGKSRLAIELALCFNGEVLNSDKIQVHRGLDIVTNKVTEEEARGVPHHLIGIIDPEDDFSEKNFVKYASQEVAAITQRGQLPIIAGGSNSYMRALLVDDVNFRSKYEYCLIWLDASAPILKVHLSKRVDKMVERGLVEEVKEFFDSKSDYSRGIKRSIGVPEMDEFFRKESKLDEEARSQLLKASIDQIKKNTYKLALKQLDNIYNLMEMLSWKMDRLDATETLLNKGVHAGEAWEKGVFRPSFTIVNYFLYNKKSLSSMAKSA